MPTDPSSDLIQQLARIADALSKSSSSPWIIWAQTLASFVAGISATYFGIWLQERFRDGREQRKMRRILYTELTNSFLFLYGSVVKLRAMEESPRKPNSEGKIYPPALEMINPPITFEGEDYMRQHQSVSFELSEMAALKRMYHDLSFMRPGATVLLGEFEGALVKFAEAFKSDVVIRSNFLEFAGTSSDALETVANYFADYPVKLENLTIQIKERASGNSE